jgi:Cys-tRNA(Pro) deacylase
MTTRGIEQLKREGVPFEELTYRPDAEGVRFAARALELDPRTVIKTLVFQADDRTFLLALMAGDGAVSEKKLARSSGHKKVSPASPRDAERVTGYEIGGISPLGLRRPLPVVLDRGLAQHPSVAINAGARGTLVRLGTADLVRLVDAAVADVRIEHE